MSYFGKDSKENSCRNDGKCLATVRACSRIRPAEGLENVQPSKGKAKLLQACLCRVDTRVHQGCPPECIHHSALWSKAWFHLMTRQQSLPRLPLLFAELIRKAVACCFALFLR